MQALSMARRARAAADLVEDLSLSEVRRRLLAHARNQTDLPLREIGRPLQAVPLTASLSAALDQLLNLREHIALVVDEFGGIAAAISPAL